MLKQYLNRDVVARWSPCVYPPAQDLASGCWLASGETGGVEKPCQAIGCRVECLRSHMPYKVVLQVVLELPRHEGRSIIHHNAIRQAMGCKDLVEGPDGHP